MVEVRLTSEFGGRRAGRGWMLCHQPRDAD